MADWVDEVFASLDAKFDWRQAAEQLWYLLDQIDTVDDAARDNDVLFRRAVRALVFRRHKVLRCDGKVLKPRQQKTLGEVLGEDVDGSQKVHLPV